MVSEALLALPITDLKMSTQVDLFTTVEPTSVSPAIAKPLLCVCVAVILVETKYWKAVKSGRIMQTFRAKYSMNPSFLKI